jgi:sulfide dehydrogenase cytochrome subunit
MGKIPYNKRNRWHRGIQTGALLGLLAFGPTVGAASASRPEAMAFQCYTCHGTDGHSEGAILPLAGRDHAFIAEQLRAFKAGTLPATIMDRIAKGFSEEEIEAIAAYIGNHKKAAPRRAHDGVDAGGRATHGTVAEDKRGRKP